MDKILVANVGIISSFNGNSHPTSHGNNNNTPKLAGVNQHPNRVTTTVEIGNSLLTSPVINNLGNNINDEKIQDDSSLSKINTVLNKDTFLQMLNVLTEQVRTAKNLDGWEQNLGPINVWNFQIEQLQKVLCLLNSGNSLQTSHSNSSTNNTEKIVT